MLARKHNEIVQRLPPHHALFVRDASSTIDGRTVVGREVGAEPSLMASDEPRQLDFVSFLAGADGGRPFDSNVFAGVQPNGPSLIFCRR